MSVSSRAAADKDARAAVVAELHAGPLRLAVRPDLGGCIAGLWHEGVPVLKSAEPLDIEASRPSACFPLLPYSNRLGHRRFQWQGHAYMTAANFAGSPHSLHGVAWLKVWELVSVSDDALVLRCHHLPDEHWPFAFHAEQRFELDRRGIGVRLVVTNTDSQVQPMGLGWHPYFYRRSLSRLQAQLTSRWDNDADQLPTRTVSQSGIDEQIDRLRVDHCFDGWPGVARIFDDRFELTVSSSLGRLVVYTPQDKDYFCVEPVSHVNNALQMADPLAHGVIALRPGEIAEAWMKLDVNPL